VFTARYGICVCVCVCVREREKLNAKLCTPPKRSLRLRHHKIAPHTVSRPLLQFTLRWEIQR